MRKGYSRKDTPIVHTTTGHKPLLASEHIGNIGQLTEDELIEDEIEDSQQQLIQPQQQQQQPSHSSRASASSDNTPPCSQCPLVCPLSSLAAAMDTTAATDAAAAAVGDAVSCLMPCPLDKQHSGVEEYSALTAAASSPSPSAAGVATSGLQGGSGAAENGCLGNGDNRASVTSIATGTTASVSTDGNISSSRSDATSEQPLQSTAPEMAADLIDELDREQVAEECSVQSITPAVVHTATRPLHKSKAFSRRDTPRNVELVRPDRGFTKQFVSSAPTPLCEELDDEEEEEKVEDDAMETTNQPTADSASTGFFSTSSAPSYTATVGAASGEPKALDSTSDRAPTEADRAVRGSNANDETASQSSHDNDNHSTTTTTTSVPANDSTAVTSSKINVGARPKNAKVLQRKNTPAILPKVQGLYGSKIKQQSSNDVFCEEEEDAAGEQGNEMVVD